MTKIAIALGGNIGNVKETFDKAVSMLDKGGLRKILLSPILNNPAVGCIEGTPDFQNAALTGEWSGTAQELLSLCQKIEITHGRPKDHQSNMSRTIDLDIILFGKSIIQSKTLTIPHPRSQERAFVLIPLSQIAPDWIFHNTGNSVQKALDILTHKSHQGKH